MLGLSSTIAGLSSKLKVGKSIKGSCTGIAFGVESSGLGSVRSSSSLAASLANLDPASGDSGSGGGTADDEMPVNACGVARLFRSHSCKGARFQDPRGCLNSKNDTEATKAPRPIQPMEKLVVSRNVDSSFAGEQKVDEGASLFAADELAKG